MYFVPQSERLKLQKTEETHTSSLLPGYYIVLSQQEAKKIGSAKQTLDSDFQTLLDRAVHHVVGFIRLDSLTGQRALDINQKFKVRLTLNEQAKTVLTRVTEYNQRVRERLKHFGR